MSEAELLADLDRTLAATEAVVAGVRADQWTAPTPCTELDARGVLNHLVRGNLLFVAIIRDEPRPVPGTDHLGGGPLAAFQRAAAQLREAFRGLARRSRSYDLRRSGPRGARPWCTSGSRRTWSMVGIWPGRPGSRGESSRTTWPGGSWSGPGSGSRPGRRVPALPSPRRSRSRRATPAIDRLAGWLGLLAQRDRATMKP